MLQLLKAKSQELAVIQATTREALKKEKFVIDALIPKVEPKVGVTPNVSTSSQVVPSVTAASSQTVPLVVVGSAAPHVVAEKQEVITEAQFTSLTSILKNGEGVTSLIHKNADKIIESLKKGNLKKVEKAVKVLTNGGTGTDFQKAF